MDKKLVLFAVLLLTALLMALLIAGRWTLSSERTLLTFHYFQFQDGGNPPGTIGKYYRAQKELEADINSGEYNIVAVKTTYLLGDLVSAEIIYDSSDDGGNKVRVLFLAANEYRLRQTQLRSLNVLKVQELYEAGVLAGAEVYYRVP